VELEALPARDVRALFLFSDAYAQGLMEGLDFHFSQAHVLGSVAAFTPFVTGREHTLFFQTPAHSRGIYEKGAVGLAIRAPASLERTYSGLVPVGPRLAITGARGNIISSLDHHNAAQQMIWLLTSRRTAQGAPIQDPQHVRSMSSQVRKDDELFLGIFACQEDAMPITMARIQSGHPMRGTISIDTDTQICSTCLHSCTARVSMDNTKTHRHLLLYDTPWHQVPRCRAHSRIWRHNKAP